MTYWLVQLEGERVDLEEVALHFDTEPMCAMKDGDKYCLRGQALEEFDDARVVRETAQSWLDEASAVVSLLWPAFRKPSAGQVFRQHEDGKRDTWVPRHVVAVLDAVAIFKGVDRIEVVRQVLEEWARQKYKEAELIARMAGTP